jgi:hypothetical protein
MAVKKKTLGKVVGESKGYRVRMIVESKLNGRKSPLISPTGKFGVYAGKKSLKNDFVSVKEALDYIETI